MQSHPGLFIVLEGSDGSGKGTQFELLQKKLLAEGYEVAVFDFPRYDKPSSHFVKKYLNGDYGPAASINPYTASLFYALDRYEASTEIKEELAAGKIVLSNRFVGSNMAHQGAKLDDTIDKRSFFVWEDSLEYQLLGIPRPTMNLYLRVPAQMSYELIKKKHARSYTDKTHDEHEADVSFLKKSVETYDLLCQLFPKDFKAIDCVEDDKLLPIEEVEAKIWEQVKPHLPTEQPAEQEPEAPINEETSVTDKAKSVTSDHQWKVSGLSLNTIIFLKHSGLQVTIDSANHWSGKGTDYRFATPTGLNKSNLEKYLSTYKQAIEIHKQVYAKLVSHYRGTGDGRKAAALKARSMSVSLIPMGALFGCSISLEKDKAEKFLIRIAGDANPEIKSFRDGFRETVKEAWPELKLNSSPSDATPKSINEILANLASTNISQNLSSDEPAKLLDVSPKNEFDLLADGIYPFSDLSREEIQQAVTKWDYAQKARALNDALQANRNLLDLASYRFDGLVDRASLLALLDSKEAESSQIQQATVRYGFEVSQAVEDSGEEDRFMSSFDNFLDLYSSLQAADSTSALDYATLVGHKVRWQGRLSAGELAELKSNPLVDEQFITYLTELMAQAHPIVSENLVRSATEIPQRAKTKK